MYEKIVYPPNSSVQEMERFPLPTCGVVSVRSAWLEHRTGGPERRKVVVVERMETPSQLSCKWVLYSVIVRAAVLKTSGG